MTIDNLNSRESGKKAFLSPPLTGSVHLRIVCFLSSLFTFVFHSCIAFLSSISCVTAFPFLFFVLFLSTGWNRSVFGADADVCKVVVCVRACVCMCGKEKKKARVASLPQCNNDVCGRKLRFGSAASSCGCRAAGLIFA